MTAASSGATAHPDARAPVAARARRITATDAAVLTALFGASLAARIPYLMLIPRFTDEVRRVLWSLRVLEGGFWPLAYKNGYNGPLIIYLNAAALAVHPGMATPRAVAAIVASLAPPALYLLGRELGGRVSGAVAGILMATSFVPVVVYGHVPWAITPAVTLMVAGLWLVARAAKRRSARALLLGAAVLGLALQTHPLVGMTLLGVGAWLVGAAHASGWPDRRLAIRALAVVALVLSPLAAHHALALAREGRIEVTSTRDLRDGGLTVDVYAAGATAMAGSLIDALTARAHDAERPRAADPFAWLIGALACAALAWCTLRGPRLAAATTAVGVLLLPALVQTYNFPLSARYTGLLLPTIYLAMGTALEAVWQRYGARQARARRRVIGLGLAGLVASLAIVPLMRIDAYYQHDVARGRTNQAVLDLVATAQLGWTAEQPGAAPLILDDEIDASFSASGNISRVLESLLGLQHVPIDKVATPAELDAALAAADGPRWVIASDAMRDGAGSGSRLAPVDGAHIAAGGDGDGYGLYGWSDVSKAVGAPVGRSTGGSALAHPSGQPGANELWAAGRRTVSAR